MDQQYLIIVMLVAAVIAVAFYIMGRKSAEGGGRFTGTDAAEAVNGASTDNDSLAVSSEQSPPQVALTEPDLPAVRFEEVTALSPVDEERLVEIGDSCLLARIDSVVPVAVQGVANAFTVQSLSNVIEAQNAGGQLYRVIIPSGAELSKSAAMEGAFRGFYHGPDGIAGHANLVQADAAVSSDMASAISNANALSMAMNIGSMVVGQYYMSQISGRLETVTKSIDKIADFQNNRFRSKLYALVAEVQRCSKFQMETLESEEARQRELTFLKTLEYDCSQLLGQANVTLQGYSEKDLFSFDEYETLVGEADEWFRHQQVLLRVMQEIAKLTYALGLGSVSMENSVAMYLPYVRQANETILRLSQWHGRHMSRFELDETKSSRKREGLGAVLLSAPAFFVEDLNRVDVDKRTANMIERQTHGGQSADEAVEPDLYQENVCLIARSGRVYYLPPEGGNGGR